MTQVQQAIYVFSVGGNTARSKTGQHPVEIDWNKLPDASQDFVIRYGLKQYLADGMAGATSSVEAKEGIDARLAKLATADFQRTLGEGKAQDTVGTRAIKLAKEFLRSALKAKNATADKDVVALAAAKLVETQPKWKAEAQKQLDAEAKSKANLADDEATQDILNDLLGDLLGEQDESTDEDLEDPAS